MPTTSCRPTLGSGTPKNSDTTFGSGLTTTWRIDKQSGRPWPLACRNFGRPRAPARKKKSAGIGLRRDEVPAGLGMRRADRKLAGLGLRRDKTLAGLGLRRGETLAGLRLRRDKTPAGLKLRSVDKQPAGLWLCCVDKKRPVSGSGATKLWQTSGTGAAKLWPTSCLRRAKVPAGLGPPACRNPGRLRASTRRQKTAGLGLRSGEVLANLGPPAQRGSGRPRASGATKPRPALGSGAPTKNGRLGLRRVEVPACLGLLRVNKKTADLGPPARRNSGRTRAQARQSSGRPRLRRAEVPAGFGLRPVEIPAAEVPAAGAFGPRRLHPLFSLSSLWRVLASA